MKQYKIIITLIIIINGDFEKNPGPYNFAGIVQSSFGEGHKKFRVTRRIQCTYLY